MLNRTTTQTILAIFASAAALAACTTTSAKDPSGKANGDGSDAGSGLTLAVCFLNYGNNLKCDATTGKCAGTSVTGITHDVVSGYPSFNDALGDTTFPFYGSVSAVPATLPDGSSSASTGLFSVRIQDSSNTNTQLPYLAAGDQTVSLDALAETGKDGVKAGDVRVTVPTFTYFRQQWNQVELSCTITTE
jgi:hypothetical protein